MYDLELDREFCQAVIAAGGPEAFLRCLGDAMRRKDRGGLDLYSFSRDWEYIPTIRVIKARGAKGDVLVKLT